MVKIYDYSPGLVPFIPATVTSVLVITYSSLQSKESPEQETIKLKSVVQKLQKLSTCKPLHMKPGMMCAGSVATKKPRPASGDSGSGLVTNTHELIGLLSFKVMKYPALPVYTNVSYYYGWLRRGLQKIC